MNLTIFESIDNVYDELSRSIDFLEPGNLQGADELHDDIDADIDRMSDIKERIEFALKIAVCAGHINAKKDFEFECDNSEWCEKYLEAASQVEFQYDDEGYVDSEWAYEEADRIAKSLFEEE